MIIPPGLKPGAIQKSDANFPRPRLEFAWENGLGIGVPPSAVEIFYNLKGHASKASNAREALMKY